MRIYLHLTPNTRPVPFNYQQSLVGAFHKWLGPNELHDEISLYSLSWLSGGRAHSEGLDFPNGSIFYISAPDPTLLHDLIQGIFKGHIINWGMKVHEVNIKRTPDFGECQWFFTETPILIKRPSPDHKHHQYYYPSDEEADIFLTETLRHKLQKANKPDTVSVRFDPDYKNPKIKMITYGGIQIKATYSPVIVEGDPKAVKFCWDVGVGSSTGIGFGALR